MGQRIALLSAAAVIAAWGGRLYVSNDATPNRIEDLQNELVEIGSQMRTLQATADAANRALTPEEATELDGYLARFEQIEEDIERRESVAAAQARLAEPQGRRTDPDDVVNRSDEEQRPEAAAARRRRVAPQARNPEDAGRWGFRSFGEFATAVRSAANPSRGNVDPRLIANAGPAQFGREGEGEDGGFAVPPDFRADIVKKIQGEESLLSRTDQQVSQSNTVTYPVDETNPGSASGIQARWTGEGEQKTPSKPALTDVTIRLNKLTSLVPVTDELLEDAPGLSNYLRTKTPEVMTAKVNDAIVRGTGAGMPLGILNAPALITAAKEAGQAADTIVFANIVNMWSRLASSYRSDAVWLINQDIEPQLLGMQFPGTGTAVPAYMPPGGLADAPFGRLLNRPVIPTESTSALGDVGDIILVNLKQYLTLQKVGGIRQDVSIHLWFDFDMTAFRFVLRVAGQPWHKSPITPRNSAVTRGAFVALADRA